MSELIERIKKLVINEDNIKLYNNHISLVVKYASQLAEIEGEDVIDMKIAALLHDIGRIRYGGENHNLKGTADARKILEAENYDSAKTKKICNAIISHGGTEEYPVKDKFGEILRCADGLSHHDVVPLFLIFNLKKKNGDLGQAIQKLTSKLEFEWNKKITLPSAKKIGQEKYGAAMLILKSNLNLIMEAKNEQ